MKIIDLLNKIANGEKLPKRIVYENIHWDLCTLNNTYDDGEECLFEDYIDKYYVITDVLNDEVEIIEEEKKIPEKSNIDFNTKLPVSGCSENEAFMMTCISHLGKTIDSLIDYLKSKGDE